MSRARWLVLAVALAACLPSIRNGFVYDDVSAVSQDPRIRSLNPLRLVTIPYWRAEEMKDRLYRPATTLSFALDWAAGRGSAVPFHVTNIALHLVAALLAFTLAGRVLGTGAGAVVAGLWFAVHPIHVEALSSVVGRSELLAAVGYLGAVLAYMAEADAAARAPAGILRAALVVAVLGCTALALGSKEHAVTLPAGLALADVWRARRAGRSAFFAFARHALLWAAVVTLAVGALAARTAVLGTTFGGGRVAAGLEYLNPAGRTLVMLPAFAIWARLLAWPLHLSADYSPDAFVPRATAGAAQFAAAALIAGAVLVAWALRRRAAGVLFGLVWFTVTASVAANILVPTGVLLAERALYLPSVGAAIAVGALWELIPGGRPVWPATALAVTLLGARSLERAQVWRDERHFVAALLEDAPDSYRSHWALGARAFEAGRYADGEREYRRAMAIWPLDAAVPQELGERYLRSGLWVPADRYLTAAWRVDSSRADAALAAIVARLRSGHSASAAALGEEAIRRFPAAPALLSVTAEAYLALGRPAAALALRRRAAVSAPGAWQYQQLAAAAAAFAGRCDEARRRGARAAALAPGEQAPRRLVAELSTGKPSCGVRP